MLRGPQGTLFGRNTEGGALSIVTKAPTGEFGGRGDGGIGNYGQRTTARSTSTCRQFANLAIKIDGVIQHQDATAKNPLAGQDGWNYNNTVGGRVAGALDAGRRPHGRSRPTTAPRTRTRPFYSQLLNYNPNGYDVGTYVGANGIDRSLQRRGLQRRQRDVPRSSTTCIAPLSPLVVVSGDNARRPPKSACRSSPASTNPRRRRRPMKYKVTPDLELRSITGWRRSARTSGTIRAARTARSSHPNANFGRYSLSDLYQHQFSQEFQAVGSIPHQFDYVARRSTTSHEHVTRIGGDADHQPLERRRHGLHDPLETRTASPAAVNSGNGQRPTRAGTATSGSFSAPAAPTPRATPSSARPPGRPIGFDMLHLTGGGR